MLDPYKRKSHKYLPFRYHDLHLVYYKMVS